MASQALFDAVPPFPDDVAVAPMHTVLLRQLRVGDVEAAKILLQACRDTGFFFLDLSDDAIGEKVVEEIDNIFEAGKDIMHLPEDVKKECAHDPPKSFLGYVCIFVTKTSRILTL